MAQCSVSLSANAGISLQFGGHKIWIDALHTNKVPGFSSLPADLWTQLQTQDAFQDPDIICFTHCHEDHFDLQMVSEAKAKWPRAALILPEEHFEEQLFLTGREVRFTHEALSFRFLRLVHENEQYADVPHYGILISDGSFTILITGDCEVGNPMLEHFLEGVSVDLAIMNFPWLALRKGHTFVQKIIHPEHLLVYHLPFEEDDENGFRDSARRAAARSDLPDVRLLCNPLQETLYYYEKP